MKELFFDNDKKVLEKVDLKVLKRLTQRVNLFNKSLEKFSKETKVPLTASIIFKIDLTNLRKEED